MRQAQVTCNHLMVLIPDINMKLMRGTITLLSEQQAKKSTDLWRLAEKGMLTIRWIANAPEKAKAGVIPPALVTPIPAARTAEVRALQDEERFERLKESLQREVRQTLSGFVGQIATKDHLKDALQETLRQLSGVSSPGTPIGSEVSQDTQQPGQVVAHLEKSESVIVGDPPKESESQGEDSHESSLNMRTSKRKGK